MFSSISVKSVTTHPVNPRTTVLTASRLTTKYLVHIIVPRICWWSGNITVLSSAITKLRTRAQPFGTVVLPCMEGRFDSSVDPLLPLSAILLTRSGIQVQANLSAKRVLTRSATLHLKRTVSRAKHYFLVPLLHWLERAGKGALELDGRWCLLFSTICDFLTQKISAFLPGTLYCVQFISYAVWVPNFTHHVSQLSQDSFMNVVFAHAAGSLHTDHCFGQRLLRAIVVTIFHPFR